MAKQRETYIPLNCAAVVDDGQCGAELGFVEISHHSVTVQVCNKCGQAWRVYHAMNGRNVEMTAIRRPIPSDVPVQFIVAWEKK